METKHTPGPWNFDGNGINAKGERILKVQYQRHDGNGKISERFDADSNLAAAAPELLAALELTLEPLDIGEDCGLTADTYNIVCAAIAKATGAQA